MEHEKLRIFNDQHETIGAAARSDVHAQGLWHETFHFWLLKKEHGTVYLYFQLRSPAKKDFPSLFDITAAGHLLADEQPSGGLREVEEELGLSIHFEDLTFAGVIQDEIHMPPFIDREFCHVYLYMYQEKYMEVYLQKEEVAGLYRAKLLDAQQLLTGTCERIRIEGFQVDANEERREESIEVGVHDFVQHEHAYYEHLFHAINQFLSQ
ncbi:MULTISPECIES: NUDIX domain-containing protein [Bacillus]|uniref:NUDIX hydrolase n=1 Tax=Bacillus TaxID=1386 RepID=UPI0006F35324|nr:MULTISPECIES: NUDIX domain-containing protein [Bacillus]KRE13978.1 hydrolase [Bacillus sp. Root920]MBZ9522604.1 NUDIX domain-containing protein [Bacillus safensis]MCY1093945.1 NUDIX domain-containing protein [Bacillus safensis]MCY7471685.1 NUDIX domain-containing protein [Bacillus safensis]MCY7480319.1 NUDIX domain-containing protein [Bacillus safensis]